MRIYRIRLSDKTSRLTTTGRDQAGSDVRAEVLVKVREWIGSALASPDFVLEAHHRRNRTAV